MPFCTKSNRRQFVEVLSETMRRFTAGTHFVDAMMDISHWGDVAAFLNREGDIMLKVLVGRDEKRELKADQLDVPLMRMSCALN